MDRRPEREPGVVIKGPPLEVPGVAAGESLATGFARHIQDYISSVRLLERASITSGTDMGLNFSAQRTAAGVPIPGWMWPGGCIAYGYSWISRQALEHRRPKSASAGYTRYDMF